MQMVLDVAGHHLLRHARERRPEEDRLHRGVADVRLQAGGHLLGRAVEEVAERAAEVPLAETVRIDRAGRRLVRALDHVAAVGVDLVGEMAGDEGPVRLRVLARPPLDPAGHASSSGVVTAVGQPVAIGLDERRVDAQQALAELPGSPRPLRPLVAHPDRQPLLQRSGRDDALVPQAANLPRPTVGVRVAAGQVDAVELELRNAVARSQAELEAAAADDVDDRRLLGELGWVVERRDDDRRADARSARAGGHRGGQRQRLGQVAVVETVVLRQPDRVAPEALGLLAHLQREAVEAAEVGRPLGWVAQIEVAGQRSFQ